MLTVLPRSSDKQRGRVRAACNPDHVQVDDRDRLCAGDVHERPVELRLPRVLVQSHVSTRAMYAPWDIMAERIDGEDCRARWAGSRPH